jgi:hypothetical protein
MTEVINRKRSQASQTPEPLRNLLAQVLMAAGLMLFMLLGSLFLYRMEMPRIVTALFLSAGVTLLVYHFLGGIPIESEFHLGALRVGGSMAVLLGVAWWLNGLSNLDPQYRFHVLSPHSIVGTWNWKSVDTKGGMDGTLVFNEDFSFTGQEYRWVPAANGQTNRVLFLDMTKGKWALSDDRTSLSLESDVKEYDYGRSFHWKTNEPLGLVAAFGGQLWPKLPGDAIEAQPWGILITKNTSLSH